MNRKDVRKACTIYLAACGRLGARTRIGLTLEDGGWRYKYLDHLTSLHLPVPYWSQEKAPYLRDQVHAEYQCSSIQPYEHTCNDQIKQQGW